MTTAALLRHSSTCETESELVLGAVVCRSSGDGDADGGDDGEVDHVDVDLLLDVVVTTPVPDSGLQRVLVVGYYSS